MDSGREPTTRVSPLVAVARMEFAVETAARRSVSDEGEFVCDDPSAKVAGVEELQRKYHG